MTNWWEGLDFLQKIFMIMAIPATAILVIQTILLLFGFSGHDASTDTDTSGLDLDQTDFPDASMDMDGDTDPGNLDAHDASDGLRLFTVRGFVAFFTVFGWSGLVMTRSGVSPALSVVLAIVAGFAMMLVLALFLKWAMRLQSSGNIDRKNAIGKSASVYITIPPMRSGSGKVSVMVQEQLCEMDAVTDQEQEIRSGAQVTVVSVSPDGPLVVRPKIVPPSGGLQ